MFHERRSLAFGIFRMGPGISGPLVPLVGWMIGLWGWRTAAVLSGLHHFLDGLPIAYDHQTRSTTQEERDARSVRRKRTGIQRAATLFDRSAVYFERSVAHQSLLVSSVAMALRHMVTEGVSVHFVILARRPRLEHGGGEQLARRSRR